MMSYEQIAADSRAAANRARKASTQPKTFVGLGHDAIEAEMRHTPMLGHHVPKGWKRVEAAAPRRSNGDERVMSVSPGYLFVDSSGFGRDDEGALSVREFVEYIYSHPEFGYGIVEAGQFQVTIATYERRARK